MASILIVDDSESVRALLAHTVSNAGHTVTMAENGAAALRAISRNRFDVIVTDIYMPETDGIELLATLRTEGVDSAIIAMSSASGERDLMNVARHLGATKTLRKPFRPSELLSGIDAILRARQAPPISPLPQL